ncbi:hypothetical protein [Desulforhopalus singaporensis]|nr:hypothetical protein [Desulforhopalus singaporensis]
MGYQLWVSPVTGYRRKGTRFSALRKIFIDNITARNIYEPLLCCPVHSHAHDAREALRIRDFDVAGVKETEGGEVVGYVQAVDLGDEDLGKYVKKITSDLLISDSTPIAEIFSVLTEINFAFVISGKHISGIITKADINKPPVRIYLFGITSLFEMHLNAWVKHYYSDDSWVSEVPGQRMQEASKIYELRQGNNQDLSLIECLQLCDKRDLLAKSQQFRKDFDFSRRSFDSFVKDLEKIRNELAHSQYSIIANIEWPRLIEIISSAEAFLINSDIKVDNIAAEGKDFQDLLI